MTDNSTRRRTQLVNRIILPAVELAVKGLLLSSHMKKNHISLSDMSGMAVSDPEEAMSDLIDGGFSLFKEVTAYLAGESDSLEMVDTEPDVSTSDSPWPPDPSRVNLHPDFDSPEVTPPVDLTVGETDQDESDEPEESEFQPGDLEPFEDDIAIQH
jgi:hypothetical protein